MITRLRLKKEGQTRLTDEIKTRLRRAEDLISQHMMNCLSSAYYGQSVSPNSSLATAEKFSNDLSMNIMSH